MTTEAYILVRLSHVGSTDSFVMREGEFKRLQDALEAAWAKLDPTWDTFETEHRQPTRHGHVLIRLDQVVSCYYEVATFTSE